MIKKTIINGLKKNSKNKWNDKNNKINEKFNSSMTNAKHKKFHFSK